ncbi:hypothetical protein BDV25DRAFT_140039 [Aspergillus avenaceus]|uniref:Uncharacterized protein n=1 Tax=Aspergillus avenaceus TaxID=36643 RepID=A0A5N6TV04_ASPAV|nr:hypothetical protein BDV25DRAFT_140039 [Aspergillus avenaceus]
MSGTVNISTPPVPTVLAEKRHHLSTDDDELPPAFEKTQQVHEWCMNSIYKSNEKYWNAITMLRGTPWDEVKWTETIKDANTACKGEDRLTISVTMQRYYMIQEQLSDSVRFKHQRVNAKALSPTFGFDDVCMLNRSIVSGSLLESQGQDWELTDSFLKELYGQLHLATGEVALVFGEGDDGGDE